MLSLLYVLYLSIDCMYYIYLYHLLYVLYYISIDCYHFIIVIIFSFFVFNCLTFQLVLEVMCMLVKV